MDSASKWKEPQGGIWTLNTWYWKEKCLVPDTGILVDLVLQNEIQLPLFSPKINFATILSEYEERMLEV